MTMAKERVPWYYHVWRCAGCGRWMSFHTKSAIGTEAYCGGCGQTICPKCDKNAMCGRMAIHQNVSDHWDEKWLQEECLTPERLLDWFKPVREAMLRQ